MSKTIGVLTAGSDCPGLNAAIRAIGKAAQDSGFDAIGFQDGFQGLMEDRTIPIVSSTLSGILTKGGTLLGTSRDRPGRDPSQPADDRLDQAVEVYRSHNLDGLVCIGGRETQDTASILAQKGLRVLSIPKGISNDVAETDETIGFHTAMEVAVESIDRLHSTAHSHHRILVVELMGRSSGWLTLGAGISGGADIILIPEIPYDFNRVVQAVEDRKAAGKSFSIVAVAERTVPREYLDFSERLGRMNDRLRTGQERDQIASQLSHFEDRYTATTTYLAERLEEKTGLDTRVTILGYLLRGGVPSAGDRLLATLMGTASVQYLDQGLSGEMIARREGKIATVPLDQVINRHKPVPSDHPWLVSARRVGTCFGD